LDVIKLYFVLNKLKMHIIRVFISLRLLSNIDDSCNIAAAVA